MRRLGTGLLVLLVLLLTGAQSAAARPGGTVFSYGYFGTVDITEALPGTLAEKKAVAMATGPGDETLVVSSKTASCPSSVICFDLYLTRADADGKLDPAFGARSGAVLRVEQLNQPGTPREVKAALAIAGDGRVTVAAGTPGGIVLARLNPDGSLDPSFGAGGRVTTPLPGAATVTGLALGPGGSTLVTGGYAGLGTAASGSDLLLAKYTAAGLLDQGFGVGGFSVADLGGNEVPAAVAIGQNRAHLGVPVCCSGAGEQLRVAYFNPNGSFARARAIKLPGRLKAGKPRGIASVLATQRGAIDVVGSAGKGTFVARMLGNGEPDLTFGERGYALVRGLFVEGPSAAVVDKKGRILLTGWRRDPPDTEGNRAHVVRVFRLLANGRPDPKYGGVRPLLTVVSGTRKVGLDINRPLGIGLRSDGRISVLGEAIADPREGISPGPWFGLSLFLGK